VTVYYPDISGFQAGIDLKGALAAACKATEGTGYANPDFARARANAASHGTFFMAYHFLHAGSAALQARWCYMNVGPSTPLMLDVEPTTGSNPSPADVAAFVAAYRALGGTIHLVYLPRWYWLQIGSPPLASAFSAAQLALVSSAYTPYTDSSSGTGWLPYGGITPIVWQYTDALSFNGHSVDFNAFRGHYAGKEDAASVAACLAELKSIAKTGRYPAPPPPPPPPTPSGKAANPVSSFKVTPQEFGVNFAWSPTANATSYLLNIWTPGPVGIRKLADSYEFSNRTSVTIYHLGHGKQYTATLLAKPNTLAGSLRRARVTFTTSE
jgi:hypothetical protein